jgi:hypothetical protein
MPIGTLTRKIQCQSSRSVSPARRDVTPCLRQQPQDRQHALLDARKLADYELAAQALHLACHAVVERGDQVWRAPRRRQEVVAEEGH